MSTTTTTQTFTPRRYDQLPPDLQDLTDVIDNTMAFCGSTAEAKREWIHENRPVTEWEWIEVLQAIHVKNETARAAVRGTYWTRTR